MKKVQLLNQNIMSILFNISRYIEDNDVQELLNKRVVHQKNELNNIHTPYSEEYLSLAMNNPTDYQFPADSLGIGVKSYIGNDIMEDRLQLLGLIQELGELLGANKNALSMYYPTGGYIGWHHNGNAPGYNILFTYSQTGAGSFDYFDYNTKTIIKMTDEKGWNVKAGYYPSIEKEKNNIFWHTAWTKCPRLTIAFILNNKILWEDMIDEVEDAG